MPPEVDLDKLFGTLATPFYQDKEFRKVLIAAGISQLLKIFLEITVTGNIF